MASNVTITNTLVDGAANAAAPVMQNFNDILTWINTNAVHLDGSKAFTGVPSGPASDPVSANQLARKAYVDAILPTGMITEFAGTVAPTGWLLCQGQAVSRSTYSALFGVTSTTYGAGDGSTTFNLPDMRGRVPVGLAASGTFGALNNAGGAETHTIGTTNLPPHTHGAGTLATSAHSVSDPGHFHAQRIVATNGSYLPGSYRADYQADTTTPNLNLEQGANTIAATTGITVGNHTMSGSTDNGPGSSAAVNHMNPYRVVNYIIKT